MKLPQVGKRTQKSRLVAVKRRVTDGRLGFVGVAGEDSSDTRRYRRQNSRTAVAGLNVLANEIRHVQADAFELLDRPIDRLLNRHDEIFATEIFGKLFAQIFCRRRIEDARHIDEINIFRADDLTVQRGGDRRINAARNADDDFLNADLLKESFHAEVKRAINFFRLRLVVKFKRGHFVNLVKVDEIQTFRERFDALNDFAA